MGRSGYCCSLSDDDHKKCPDAIEDTGACDCPCHLDQEEDVEVSRIRTAQTSVGKIKLPPVDYPSLPIEAEVADDLPTPPAQQLDISGEDWERTNNWIRATWAGEALKVFARRTGTLISEELDTVLQDLLADLMHLADALQQGGGMERNFDELLERARRCHEEERRGEP
jgi:hypothetical protein